MSAPQTFAPRPNGKSSKNIAFVQCPLFRTDWRHAGALLWLCVLLLGAAVYGPLGYLNGYGLSNGAAANAAMPFGTTATVTAGAGTATVSVASTAGLANGENVGIMGAAGNVEQVQAVASFVANVSITFPVATPGDTARVLYGTRLVNGPCAENTWCQDKDIPLVPGTASPSCGPSSPQYAGDTSHPTTGGCDVVAAGSAFMVAAWNLDHTIAASSAAAQLLSARSCADSGLLVHSLDDSVLYVPISANGNVGVWATFNPSANPVLTPILTNHQSVGFSVGGGCPQASKTEAHTYYGYASSAAGASPCSSHVGLCQLDPTTNTTTLLFDLNTVMTAQYGATWANDEEGGAVLQGGEVDCGNDNTGAGYDSACAFSIGVGSESENNWRLACIWYRVAQVVTCPDIKQDLVWTAPTGSGANTWPNGTAPSCLTSYGGNVAACTGIGTEYCTVNGTTCLSPGNWTGNIACYQPMLGTYSLDACPGIHGVGYAEFNTGTLFHYYVNVSLETYGPTYYQADNNTMGTCPTANYNACPSPILNGAGHRASGGNIACGMDEETSYSGYLICVQNNNVATLYFKNQRGGSTVYARDGHNSFVQVSTTLLLGWMTFGSFEQGTSQLTTLVASGTSVTATCTNISTLNSCFPYMLPPTQVQIECTGTCPGALPSSLLGVFTITGFPTPTTFTFANTTAAGTYSAGGGQALFGQANLCGTPSTIGANSIAAYQWQVSTTLASPTFTNSGTYGAWENFRILSRKYLDTCAANQNFYAETDGNSSKDGKWYYLTTNKLSYYGGSNVSCPPGGTGCTTGSTLPLQVGVIVELLPTPSTSLPAPSPASFAMVTFAGAFIFVYSPGLWAKVRKRKKEWKN